MRPPTGEARAARRPEDASLGRRGALIVGVGFVVMGLSACRTVPVARLNLASPDVVQRSGQAVWTPGRGNGEVVVDLEVWTRRDGSCVVDVSKAGLPFLVAQVTPLDWRIDASDGRRHSGHGAPPARVGWLQLARTLGGQEPIAPWQREPRSPDGWRVRNRQTGESFDGVLSP